MPSNSLFKAFSDKFWLTSEIALFCLATTNPALAQIVPDATLPNNSIVTPQGNTSVIEGGTRTGGNLFHSFKEFSVPTGREAFFNNAADIQNIFSRVTGGSISNIDGLIRANGTANLFLLNPSGIIFGPNARLNIGGSFLASTANSLIFADGTVFNATPSQTTPLLTVSVPIGLQYGGTAGGIRVQGKGQELGSEGTKERFDSSLNPFEVKPGKTLALVGGNLIVDGGILQASGGRIELGGLAGEGTIAINTDGSLSFPDGVQRGDVSITNKAGINVLAGGGGSIAINARNVEISGSSLLSAGIARGLGSFETMAGEISLHATEAIAIASSQVANTIHPDAIGNSGNIDITTGSLSVTNGTTLATSTFGKGEAGDIRIVAGNTVSFDGNSRAGTTVQEQGTGAAGDINITTGSLFVTGSAVLGASTFGQGKAGNITINARDIVSFAGAKSSAASTVEEKAVGAGGDINITTGSLSVTDGALLAASSLGEGKAGNISIVAGDSVSFEGKSLASSTVEPTGKGEGGDITITTGSLFVAGGAELAVSTKGQGEGGDISITTDSLWVTGGSTLGASSFGLGKAGNITIDARDTVSFAGEKSAAVSTIQEKGVGAGGDITITTGSLFVTDGAVLAASTFGVGKAGNITINARDTVSFEGMSGAASTVEKNAVGEGGNISITTGSLSVTGGSILAVSTFGLGKAGSITIDARDRVLFAGEKSAAASTIQEQGVGEGGDITITTGSLFVTDAAFLAASTLGVGKAGNITIDARDRVSFDRLSGAVSTVQEKGVGEGGNITITTGSLSVTDSSRLGASTFGVGKAGNITINARDTVSFVGEKSAAASAVQENAVGKGGDISITTGSLFLSDGAELTASSLGKGVAGNIEVNADSIRLDNRARISADTTGGQGDIFLRSQSLRLTGGSSITTNASITTNIPEDLSGGNIDVQASLLILRQNSLIATNAQGTDVKGGNITLDTDVMAALENSDISANSENFFGGQVTINAQGIFGTEFRDETTDESDITATGKDSSFSGTVQINTPDVDPSSGLVELPQNFVDATGLIADRCSPARQSSSFVVTGRGGIPTSPDEPLNPESFLVDLIELDSHKQGSTGAEGQRGRGTQEKSQSTPSTEIVEATGWIVGSNGEIILTAEAPSNTPRRPVLTHPDCSTLSNSGPVQ